MLGGTIEAGYRIRIRAQQNKTKKTNNNKKPTTKQNKKINNKKETKKDIGPADRDQRVIESYQTNARYSICMHIPSQL